MMRWIVTILWAMSAFAQSPTNLDFEANGKLGAVPPGWTAFSNPSTFAFQAVLVNSGCVQGKQCAMMTGPSNVPSTAFGDLSETVSATPYLGHTVRFRVAVRAQGSSPPYGELWIRVDRGNGTSSALINGTPINAAGWQYYTADAPVAADSRQIVFGVLNFGTGSIWVDDASFQALPDFQPEPPRPLTATGLANLTAFARLLGQVRFFHPSDQAAQLDWNAFAVQGVRAIESAATPDDLASQLQSFFNPAAPTVQVYSTGHTPDLPADLQPASRAGLQLIHWVNFGVYLSANSNVYHSTRETTAADGILPDGFYDPLQPYIADLGGGVSAMVPLSLFSDSGGTLPHQPMVTYDCCVVSADDRGTRLAGVVLAWSVAQNFYPYFDVVNTDWPGALAAALKSAATDSGADNYFRTISRMWAALHDGHGFVSGPQAYQLVPLTWDWVENQLVVTHNWFDQGQGVVPGDRILNIDGKNVDDFLSASEALISGATPQWIQYRALETMAQCNPQTNTMQLDMESFAKPGTSRSVQLTCISGNPWREPRPGVVAELEPGIVFVDINNLTETLWSAALPQLAAAKGIVFDLRGYPQIVSYLESLYPSTLNSAQWWIPTPAKPDEADFPFSRAAPWALAPLEQLGARKVFLTDGEAISFAESVMGIVEAYQLAEIVGGTTAGTNGNINFVYLPGGISCGFTGMRVLKNDGSQHHGVGIHATIPSFRTRAGVAAGLDEVLARGVQVVKGPQDGPVPAITSVVNGASFAAGPLAPGELVTIFGTNLGPAQLAQTAYDGSGYLGTYAGETRVFFDNIQAPLVYASSTQVSAIVPYQVGSSTKVRVEYQLRGSDAVTAPVAAAAPGIFGYGSKTQAVVVNQDGSFNADTNPAARGDVVTLFATGEGALSPAGVTGKLPAPGKWGAPAGTVAVKFGGEAGTILFMGEIAAGVLQLNVRVPATAPTGNAVPLAVSVGGTVTPARPTLALK